jgi:hypothetical protein
MIHCVCLDNVTPTNLGSKDVLVNGMPLALPSECLIGLSIASEESLQVSAYTGRDPRGHSLESWVSSSTLRRRLCSILQ